MRKHDLLLLILFCFVSANVKAQSWSALENGINGQVNSIAVYNGALYAAGDFDSAGTVAANDIAMWNGSSWTPAGNGVLATGFQYPQIDAIVVYNNDLYATGVFDSIAGDTTANLAKWDGNQWTAIMPGVPSGYTMAVYNNELYVASTFTKVGGVTVNGIARWNGTTWADLDGGINNGTGVATLAVYNNQLIVGGNFASVGNSHVPANNIAAWNGTSWSALGLGVADTVDSYLYGLTTYNGNLYVAGQFSQAGNVFAQNVAGWNGTTWFALGSGLGNNTDTDYVVSLLPYNGRLIAGGYFSVNGNGNPVNSIAQWDGTNWTAMGLGLDVPGYSSGYVFTLCEWNGNLYAGGFFSASGNATLYSIAEWSSPNGVNETNENVAPTLYPDPVNNLLAIEHITPGSTLTITNLLGQNVLQVMAAGARQNIDVSALSPGMYFINGAKFIKQ